MPLAKGRLKALKDEEGEKKNIGCSGCQSSCSHSAPSTQYTGIACKGICYIHCNLSWCAWLKVADAPHSRAHSHWITLPAGRDWWFWIKLNWPESHNILHSYSVIGFAWTETSVSRLEPVKRMSSERLRTIDKPLHCCHEWWQSRLSFKGIFRCLPCSKIPLGTGHEDMGAIQVAVLPYWYLAVLTHNMQGLFWRDNVMHWKPVALL